MLKKSLIALAVGMIALVLMGNAFGQPGRKRAKAKQPTANEGKPLPKPYLPGDGHTQVELKAKTNSAVNQQGTNAAPFIGNSDDGNSMRRKQPRNQKNQATAAQINANPGVTPATIKSKKPGHFVGGGDDGQSIRQKQPRKHRH